MSACFEPGATGTKAKKKCVLGMASTMLALLKPRNPSADGGPKSAATTLPRSHNVPLWDRIGHKRRKTPTGARHASAPRPSSSKTHANAKAGRRMLVVYCLEKTYITDTVAAPKTTFVLVVTFRDKRGSLRHVSAPLLTIAFPWSSAHSLGT